MALNAYLAKVVANLGPMSREKTDPAMILKEWYATGESRDNGDASDDCGVCSHTECRYMFTISNRNTGEKLESGSTCILRFSEIAYRDTNGKDLYGDEKARALQTVLNGLRADATRQARIDIIGQVENGISTIRKAKLPKNGAGVFRSACKTLRLCVESGTKAAPRDFANFVWALQAAGLAAPLSSFRGAIGLRDKDSKDFLVDLATDKKKQWRYLVLREALTDVQRRALKHHHESQS